MKEKETLQHVVDTLTDKPVTVTVTLQPVNRWENWLQKLRLKPRQHTFTIRSLRVANMYRVAARAQQIDNESLREALNQKKGIQEAVQTAMVNHIEDIVYIVAVGLSNSREEPSDSLLKMIREEFTAVELAQVMDLLMNALNLSAFLNSIVSVKSLDILTPKTSRAAGEIIAPGQSSEASASTSL